MIRCAAGAENGVFDHHHRGRMDAEVDGVGGHPVRGGTEQVGADREGERRLVLSGYAEPADDRDPLRRQVGGLRLFAARREPAHHGENPRAHEPLRALVSAGGVEPQVAVDEPELVAAHPAGGVDLVEVGAHGVALHGGVDRPGLVVNAADGDDSAATPRPPPPRPAGGGARMPVPAGRARRGAAAGAGRRRRARAALGSRRRGGARLCAAGGGGRRGLHRAVGRPGAGGDHPQRGAGLLRMCEAVRDQSAEPRRGHDRRRQKDDDDPLTHVQQRSPLRPVTQRATPSG